MSEQTYDMLVIGAGPGGQVAASEAVAAGMRTALIEAHQLGGLCHNYGCDPTKTLVDVADRLVSARRADEFGLQIPTVHLEAGAVRDRIEAALYAMRGDKSADQAAESLRAAGIDLYFNPARFLSAHCVAVGQDELTFTQAIIATGSSALVPPIPGLAESGFITNIEASRLWALPARLAIIGGGPIGIEFAQIYARFGVQVTVFEQSEQALTTEDRELAQELIELLKAEGVSFHFQAAISTVETSGDEKQITYTCGDTDSFTLAVDAILVAVGRTPAIDTLDLDAAGVAYSAEGITVDETLCTSVPHIWAIGDVTGGLQFTHLAQAQAGHAVRNAQARIAEPFSPRAIPWVTYTEPALAHVGPTEEELHRRGVVYSVATASFAANDRAVTLGRTAGKLKLLIGREGQILAGHVLGHAAGEVLAPIIVAMHAGLPIDKLATMLFPYPTLSAALQTAAKSYRAGA